MCESERVSGASVCMWAVHVDLHVYVCEWGLGVDGACVGLCVSESWGFGRVHLCRDCPCLLRGMRCAPVYGHGQVGSGPGYVLQCECVPASSVVLYLAPQARVSVVCVSPWHGSTRGSTRLPCVWACCLCHVWLCVWSVCVLVGEHECVQLSEGVAGGKQEPCWSTPRILRI